MSGEELTEKQKAWAAMKAADPRRIRARERAAERKARAVADAMVEAMAANLALARKGRY